MMRDAERAHIGSDAEVKPQRYLMRTPEDVPKQPPTKAELSARLVVAAGVIVEYSFTRSGCRDALQCREYNAELLRSSRNECTIAT